MTPPHRTTGLFLRQGSCAGTRGSWSPETWSLSSFPVLGDFPMLSTFTLPVSAWRVLEAPVAGPISPGEERVRMPGGPGNPVQASFLAHSQALEHGQ